MDLVALDRATAPPLPVLDAAVVGRMRLTTREAGVQHHVGAGLAADAVADLLRISTRTVCERLEDVDRELDRHDPAGGRAARSGPGPATALRAAGLIRPPPSSVDGGRHGSEGTGSKGSGTSGVRATAYRPARCAALASDPVASARHRGGVMTVFSVHLLLGAPAPGRRGAGGAVDV